MADIATHWSPGDSQGDWALAGADLASGADLETAVLISLFTDRQAGPDDVISDGSDDPRGWWGDRDASGGGDGVLIGSHLWLLDRARQTDDTLRRARAYIAEALAWLVDDGVAARVDVAVSWFRPGMLAAVVTVARPTGQDVVLRFDNVWEGTL